MNKADRDPVSSELRQFCWHREQSRCWYCGVDCGWGLDTGCIDHQLPRSRGGESSKENCVLSCFGCNHDKSTSNLEQFRDIVRTRIERQQLSLSRFYRGTDVEKVLKTIDPKAFRFFGERDG